MLDAQNMLWKRAGAVSKDYQDIEGERTLVETIDDDRMLCHKCGGHAVWSTHDRFVEPCIVIRCFDCRESWLVDRVTGEDIPTRCDASFIFNNGDWFDNQIKIWKSKGKLPEF